MPDALPAARCCRPSSLRHARRGAGARRRAGTLLFAEIGSTNDEAAGSRERGAREGTTIVALGANRRAGTLRPELVLTSGGRALRLGDLPERAGGPVRVSRCRRRRRGRWHSRGNGSAGRDQVAERHRGRLAGSAAVASSRAFLPRRPPRRKGCSTSFSGSASTCGPAAYPPEIADLRHVDWNQSWVVRWPPALSWRRHSPRFRNAWRNWPPAMRRRCWPGGVDWRPRPLARRWNGTRRLECAPGRPPASTRTARLRVRVDGTTERIISGTLRWMLSMLLAIDIGNTNIVLGVFDQELLTESWRLVTMRERTSDELGILVTHLFERSDIELVADRRHHPVVGRPAADANDGGDVRALFRASAR